MRIQHDIFARPNAISLTIDEITTPSYYANEGLAASLPMWRVQTEGYADGTGQPVGVVSRNAGFFDSPDVEWISSGVNSKSSEAVALGRHGNVFHWGFAASPTYMTDEAKLVFVNAVHYIANFAGQTPVARKRAGTMLRESIDGTLHGMSDEGYAEIVAAYAGYMEEDRLRKDEVRSRIEAGEDVSERDRSWLDMEPIEPPGRFERIRRFIGDDVWPSIADDEQAIRNYFADVMPYLRPEGWYELTVDEELRALGAGNDDRAFLDKAVAALSDEARADVALRLLRRYTDETLETKSEWSEWLATNDELLFYSETAGYKWLVDDRTTPPAPVASPTLTTSPKSPVAAELTVEKSSDGTVELVVNFSIEPSWHVYRDADTASYFVPLELEVKLPAGLELVGAWSKPSGRAGADAVILDGDFTFSCELRGAMDNATITCEVSYQACDDNVCYPPTSKLLSVTMSEGDTAGS